MKFSIGDENSHVARFSTLLMDSLAFIYEDTDGFEAIRAILLKEFERFDEHGLSVKPMKVTMSLLNALNPRSQQVHVAGQVALTMFVLKKSGLHHSQEAAVEIVAKLNEQSFKQEFSHWDLGKRQLVTKDVQVRSDPSNVRKAFVLYRKAAHICAARIVASEYLSQEPQYEPAPLAASCYIFTALAFQEFFADELGRTDWNLRMISYDLVLHPDAEPLQVSKQLADDILSYAR